MNRAQNSSHSAWRSRVKPALLAALAGAFFLTATQPSSAASPRNPVRYPLLPAPLLSEAPVVDGTVDKREWSGASLLPQLVDYQDAVAGSLRAKVYVGYTATHLYLAFQFHRPDGAGEPLAQTSGRDKPELAADDLWKLMLDPGNAWQTEFFLAGNARGAFEDHLRNEQAAWDPDWQYRARLTEDGWEGEIAIPFASLQRTMPTPGEIWGFDFSNAQRSPAATTLTTINRNDPLGADGLSQLIFTGRPVAVRFVESGVFGLENCGGARVDVVNLSGEPVAVEADFQLYRRKTGSAGGAANFITTIVSGMNQSGMDRVKDMQLDGLIRDGLRVYDRVETSDAVPLRRTVAPHHTTSFLVSAEEPAECLLIHQIKIDGMLVSATALPFLLPPPLLITLQPYLLTAKQLVCKLQMSELTSWQSGAKAVLTLEPVGGGAPLARAEAAYAGLPSIEAVLSLEKAPPGNYLIRAQVLDAKGHVAASRDEAYTRPAEPVWASNKLGRSVALPRPWTPVTATGKAEDLAQDVTLGVWGRTYVFATQPGFRQITSQDQALLAAPAAITATINGRPARWLCQSRRITAQREDAVEIRSEFLSEGVKLVVTAHCEFDGFVKIDLDISGPPSATIDQLSFDLPFRKEAASLYSMDMWLRRDNNAGPDRTGAIPAPPGRIAHRITQTSWVGTPEAGLMTNFQNDRDWNCRDKDDAIEVVNDGNVVRQRFRLIDQPTPMKRSRHIEFSVQATPVKPQPENRRNYRFLQTTGFGNAEKWPEMKKFVDQCKEGGIRYLIVHSDWNESEKNGIFGWPEITDPKLEAHVKRVVDYAHEQDMEVIFYVGWYISMSCQDWNIWGPEMIKAPVESGGYGTMMTVFNNAYNDATIYRISEMIDRIGFDGIYWDSTLRCCSSENPYRPGEGWYDDEGQLQPTFPIWATRDLFKRLWVLLKHEKRKDGIIYAGNPGVPFMPVETFVDIHHSGEGPEMHAKAGDLKSKYSPAYSMARSMGSAYGIITEKTVKGPMGFNALMAVDLPHDITAKGVSSSLAWNNPPIPWSDYSYARYHHTAMKIYRARQWVDVGKAQWLPYWRNSDYVKVTPSDFTLASMHLVPGERALLVVSNLDGEGRRLTVTLQPEKMGFAKDAHLTVRDAMIDGREYALNDRNELNLPIEGERYRLLMISASPPAEAPPAGGENLLPDGGMEAADGSLAGWTPGPDLNGDQVFFPDSTVARSGSASLRVTRSADTKTYLPVVATARAAVQPHKRYRLRAFVKADSEIKVAANEYGGSAAQGIAIGLEGGPLSRFVGDYTGGDWVETSVTFDSGNRSVLQVALQFYGSGTLWVDDVELQELP